LQVLWCNIVILPHGHQCAELYVWKFKEKRWCIHCGIYINCWECSYCEEKQLERYMILVVLSVKLELGPGSILYNSCCLQDVTVFLNLPLIMISRKLLENYGRTILLMVALKYSEISLSAASSGWTCCPCLGSYLSRNRWISWELKIFPKGVVFKKTYRGMG